MVYLALLWPLGQYREVGGNETGHYASLSAIIDKRKVALGIGTYSAYSVNEYVSYAHPAPFSDLKSVQEGYPISAVTNNVPCSRLRLRPEPSEYARDRITY